MKVIEFNNREYCQCDLVLVPTDDDGTALVMINNQLNVVDDIHSYENCYHLHVATHEPINVGDAFIDSENTVHICTEIKHDIGLIRWDSGTDAYDACRKIVASTECIVKSDGTHVPDMQRDFLVEYATLYNAGIPYTNALIEVDSPKSIGTFDTCVKEICVTPDNYVNLMMLSTTVIGYDETDLDYHDTVSVIDNTTVSVPIEIIENLVDLIDTPLGRRQYSKDVIDQVQQLRRIIE